MSNYGPALFIKRKDENEIPKKEQSMLLKLVTELCEKHDIRDDANNSVSPEFYDYDGYEKNSVSFLIYSSMAWGMMPEEAQQDQSEMDQIEMLKIEKGIDEEIPDTYSFQSYHVEN